MRFHSPLSAKDERGAGIRGRPLPWSSAIQEELDAPLHECSQQKNRREQHEREMKDQINQSEKDGELPTGVRRRNGSAKKRSVFSQTSQVDNKEKETDHRRATDTVLGRADFGSPQSGTALSDIFLHRFLAVLIFSQSGPCTA